MGDPEKVEPPQDDEQPGSERSPDPRPPDPPPRPDGSSGPAPAFPGADLLAGDSPREVLQRLSQGDAFGLRSRCKQRLIERALLLDVDRVQLRALARIAHMAVHYRGEPPLDDWLRARVDRSMDDLMLEDEQEERRGLPLLQPSQFFATVANHVGLEIGLARRFCNTFNALEEPMRRAVYEVMIRSKSLNRYVSEGHGPSQRVRQLIDEAMRRLSRIADEGPLGWGKP